MPSKQYNNSGAYIRPQPYSDQDDLQRPDELKVVKGKPPNFRILVHVFEQLAKPANRKNSKAVYEKRRKLLKELLQKWQGTVSKDLFPIVRLLLPMRDRQRASYGVKEQVLGKLFSRAMGLDRKSSKPAIRLQNWKQPAKGDTGAGDFAQVAYDIIKDRSPIIANEGNYDIDEVNQVLDELSKADGESDKYAAIEKLFNNLTATELKWVVRIILKDLRINISERTVLSQIHEDAITLYNVCSDLRRVCWTLYDPSIKLNSDESSIRLFMAYRPMLSKRNDKGLPHIVNLMSQKDGTSNFIIDEKLDGERIQLHKRGEEYRYWSRNDKDYTYLYGRSRLDMKGSLTKYIHSQFHHNIADIILDGEMLAYHKDLDRALPFGTLKQAALDHEQDSSITVCYRVFDVLYVRGSSNAKGKSLINAPLQERRAALQKFFTPMKGRLELVATFNGSTVTDIKKCLDDILSQNGEGLIIKKPTSKYVLNGRDDSWIKVKPDYMNELGEEVDVTVIGALYGEGRRGGSYGSFFVALKDDSKDPPVYKSLCKVGSGFKAQELKDLRDNYDWKQYPKGKPGKLPSTIAFGADIPDAYIDPSKSFVVQVKAAQIIHDAENYASGYCLRFPRCVRIREDKSPDEGMTMKEFSESMFSEKKHTDAYEPDSKRAPKRLKADLSLQSKLVPAIQGPDVSDVTKKKPIFANKLFRIITGDGNHTKQDLEKLIYTYGGAYRQNLKTEDMVYVISNRKENVVSSSALKNGHSLINPEWIISSIKKKYPIRLTRKYYTAVAEEDYVPNGESDGEDEPEDTWSEPDGDYEDESIPSLVYEGNEPQDLPPGAKAYNTPGKDWGDSYTQTPDAKDTVNVQSDYDTDSAKESIGSLDDQGKEYFKEGENEKEEEKEIPAQEHKETYQQDSGSTEADSESDIFHQIVAYFDTKEAGDLNDMPFDSSSNAVSKNDEPFLSAMNMFIKNGGKTTESLDDEQMTHIILPGPNLTRIGPLTARTSKPRPRRLVKTNWIYDSVKENTVLNEADYPPYF